MSSDAPTPSFTISSVDHTGLVVASLDEALRFWVGLLGGRILRRDRASGAGLRNVTGAPDAELEFVMLEVAGRKIELLEYAGVARIEGRIPEPFEVGALHIAVLVDDLEAMIAAVADFGWRPQGTPQVSALGATVVYIVGPDGATLEAIQLPAVPQV